MELLTRALGVEIEFVDASLNSELFIAWIAERVAEVRGAKAKLMVRPSLVPPTTPFNPVLPANPTPQSTAQNVHLARPSGSANWLSTALSPNSTTLFPPYVLGPFEGD